MDISSADIDLVIRLSSAILLGGLIGFERELHGKVAGFRTHSLVALGSALIMLVSVQIFDLYQGKAQVDPSRIAAQVVSGVGFLGAGAIIRFPRGEHEAVKGLTTAAGIWAASGIGLACGLGQYHPAIISTLLTLVILVVFSKINRLFHGRDA